MTGTVENSRRRADASVANAELAEIAGLVLAAGMSTRLGRPKQLLEIDGAPLVAHVVDRAVAGGLDPVIVVTGHDAPGVERALHTRDVVIVDNPAYASGQSTSLAAGVRALEPSVDAVVILLSDQPTIDPLVIESLVDARRAGAPLAMAQYGTTPSHPVLFGRELFSDLLAIRGDEGARSVIRRHLAHLVLVDGGSSEPPPDVDTEDAYAALLRRGLGNGATKEPLTGHPHGQ